MTTPTIGRALDDAAAALREVGVDDSRREAAQLWSVLSGVTIGAAWLEREARPPPELWDRFGAAVRRRAAGEPAAYASGRVEFRRVDLVVDRRVLIPRPETEGLVERVLSWALEVGTGGNGLEAVDVGTGSGCIALSLAVEGPFSRVVATDSSRAALAVAGENLRRLAPDVPVELRVGDLLGALAGGERFDVIVSNPPYVSAGEFERLDHSVRAFEPRGALVSGEGGLAHTRGILQNARRFLVPGGLLAIELDCRRHAAALVLAREGGWSDARVECDLFGRARYLMVNRSRMS